MTTWHELNRKHLHKYNHKYHRTHRVEIRNRKQNRNWIRKAEVLTHYGNGKLQCILCGEGDIVVLSIDHIRGGGLQHRIALGMRGSGTRFYKWLKANNFPTGFRTLCMNCQFRERAQREGWYPDGK